MIHQTDFFSLSCAIVTVCSCRRHIGPSISSLTAVLCYSGALFCPAPITRPSGGLQLQVQALKQQMTALQAQLADLARGLDGACNAAGAPGGASP